jgi:hypothetical protein
MTPGTWKRAISVVVGLVLVFAASPLLAEDWAKAMFDATSYDFGTVARGAKVEHRFKIENVYEEDIHIASVSSSCGCTTPQISKRVLKKWDTTELVAIIDTRNHLGRKDATITVKFADFDAPEVQVNIHVYIRGDIVVQPGMVRFGTVSRGSTATQEASISYAGRGDWKIEKVECASPFIDARVTETSRALGQPGQAGHVTYKLSVTLKADAPAGYLQDPLTLVTNDPNPRTAHVPIPVEGVVSTPLSVHPAQLLMGAATPGKEVTRLIFVNGSKPFRILSVSSNDARFQCRVVDEVKMAHSIPITFLCNDPKATAGLVTAKVGIATDMDGAAAEVSVSIQFFTPPEDGAGAGHRPQLD